MFGVARVLNSHGDLDYLCGWQGRWTLCSALSRALRFPTEAVAAGAAARAARLVPRFMDGRPIEWRVVPLPAPACPAS